MRSERPASLQNWVCATCYSNQPAACSCHINDFQEPVTESKYIVAPNPGYASKCYKVELPYKFAVTEGKINNYLVIRPAWMYAKNEYGKDQFDPETARLVPGRS